MEKLFLDDLLARFEADEKAALMALPLAERLPRLGELLRLSSIEAVEALGRTSGLPILKTWEALPKPADTLPLRLIHEYQCLPVEAPEGTDSSKLPLITLWPPAPEAEAWVYALTGRYPEWYLGPAAGISAKIVQSFGVGSGGLDDTGLEPMGEETALEAEDENAVVIRFVNEIFAKAVADRATDIHFEPQKETLQIRYRIDGELVPVSLPANLVRIQAAIISRLKIMARLNISEKRRPQDGRISVDAGGDSLDIRLSTLPTLYGESVSLRLLSQKSRPISIQELGYFEEDEAMLERSLARPHGIILVTGPTGSGKSTTLTACMRSIARPERRIMTVEDPVEYEVPGVNQSQVHHDIGYSFATALRHMLRQDPDVIMVGEIRDKETAEIAIRASLTGHLVLSTLHTNDAPGALTRLIDMEIEPFLVASSVEMIIAQRLVRRLCQVCARPATFEPGYLETALAALHLDPAEKAHAHLPKGPVGCEACRRLGFRGRVAIYEILRMSEALHELVVKKESARVIREQAVKEGMKTLQRCGWDQVKRGTTALPEVLKFADILEEA